MLWSRPPPVRGRTRSVRKAFVWGKEDGLGHLASAHVEYGPWPLFARPTLNEGGRRGIDVTAFRAGARGALRGLAYVTTAAVVLALPAAALPVLPPSAAARVEASAPGDDLDPVALLTGEEATPRALPVSRSTVTVDRQGPPQILTHVVAKDEILLEIAANYGVTVETIAYNNSITDATLVRDGTQLKIPPMDAAIYEVKAGDTVEAVASRFKTTITAIMETNRLYYEPENFAQGKTVLIPVPNSDYPGLQLKRSNAPAPVLTLASVPAPPVQPPTGRRLAWPVGGVITQYFWYAHRGVDIAAPYGRGIASADAGTVTAVGWVPVGGLRVCVIHEGGLETCYYHTSATYVGVGQQVGRGQIVAAIGLTGVTTGPHVHWEARLNGVLVNPLAY